MDLDVIGFQSLGGCPVFLYSLKKCMHSMADLVPVKVYISSVFALINTLKVFSSARVVGMVNLFSLRCFYAHSSFAATTSLLSILAQKFMLATVYSCPGNILVSRGNFSVATDIA
jgi:hypothetical protein